MTTLPSGRTTLMRSPWAVPAFAGMNVAVICTWVDRRQGAMIQDRVGPDRAVIWLPTWLARPLVLLPAVGAAVAVMALAFLDKQARGEALDHGGVWY